ncbi:ferritin-like domain-containing protein [Aquimarina agarivorans]|uniref:ferritin-like domain-containing protein n=1 Tax=Aquimarina agarivorans TaxID=980584 RepID=UPI000248F882|nr:PA2169 family four-helix-bundle protein [Aquimarina agarivorans]
METYSEIVSDKLNDLLEKIYDAEKGYQKAAENVEHTGLKNFFNRKAKERYDFGHELKAEIKAFGEEPNKGGSITGNLHRTWMDLKQYFGSNNTAAMLQEAIRGEKATIDAYREVLEDTTLPEKTKIILQKQMVYISKDVSKEILLEDLN